MIVQYKKVSAFAVFTSFFFILYLYLSICEFNLASAIECANSTSSNPSEICGTDTTDVNVSVTGSWAISVSSAGTLSLDITPNSSGVLSTITDNLNVYTNTPNGYQLYLNSTSGSTDIYNNNVLDENGSLDTNLPSDTNTNHFTSTTGTKESPVTLSNNTWGYTLDSLGDNPTQDTLNSTTFSKVELTNDTADSNIYTNPTKTSTSGDNIPVTYGFKADTKLTPGTYTTQVTYTAIADIPGYNITSVSPNEIRMDQQTDREITILTSVPASELGLGDISAKITNASSTSDETSANTVNLTNCTEITSNGYRGATCTFNGSLVYGTYNVELTSSWHNATYTLTAGFKMRDYRNISQITYMQEMNTDICNNSTTNQKASLLDSRGYGNGGSNKTTKYGIIKAQDGNCWMTDNLNLYNTTISASASDFTSPNDYTIPDGITQTSQWASSIYDRPMVEISHGLGRIASTNAAYYGQVYYNWCAASATSGTSYINCDTSTSPNTSICPKGWTLPTNGDINTDKSLAKLLNAYNITTGSQLLANTNLGFKLYYGHWRIYDASEAYQGSHGYSWSGTPSSASSAYSLDYVSSGVVTQLNHTKGIGWNVRCVAR